MQAWGGPKRCGADVQTVPAADAPTVAADAPTDRGEAPTGGDAPTVPAEEKTDADDAQAVPAEAPKDTADAATAAAHKGKGYGGAIDVTDDPEDVDSGDLSDQSVYLE